MDAIDTPEDSGPGWRKSIDLVRERLSGLVFGSENRQWFMMWVPAVMAAGRIATQVWGIATGVAAVVISGETLSPIPQETKDDIRDQFDTLVDNFPDVSEVLFGLKNVDELVNGLLEDDITRERLSMLGNLLTSAADNVLRRLVDAAMNPQSIDIPAESFTIYLSRLEDIVQSVVDQWVVPYVLGESVVFEDDESE